MAKLETIEGALLHAKHIVDTYDWLDHFTLTYAPEPSYPLVWEACFIYYKNRSERNLSVEDTDCLIAIVKAIQKAKEKHDG